MRQPRTPSILFRERGKVLRPRRLDAPRVRGL